MLPNDGKGIPPLRMETNRLEATPVSIMRTPATTPTPAIYLCQVSLDQLKCPLYELSAPLITPLTLSQE